MKTTNESDNHDDGLRSYYAVIKRIALLTAEEERELSSRVFSGDEEALRRLIEA
jgi:DNA-directed RNA polymerase sigma subunit (sigma70/sigma32)